MWLALNEKYPQNRCIILEELLILLNSYLGIMYGFMSLSICHRLYSILKAVSLGF